MTYSAHRSKEYQGRGDSHLPQVVRHLRRVLSDMQRDFAYDSLCLRSAALDELAGILVDFAEDIHNSTGIWEAYERYNVEFFGTALPLVQGGNDGDPITGLHPHRFRHLLWVLYPAFIDGLTLSPTHQDLQCVAEASSNFLSDAFSAIPKDSGVKSFLQTPNVYGWDVKRKLVWLGTCSFMFRTFFARYMDEKTGGRANIGRTDDFICQECTQWSGLGAIDILAGVLDISEDDRKDLRSWYERHAAFYKLLSVKNETLEAVNVISDRPYQIRINMKRHPFKAGQFVFGSLVPWRGEWYWSGEQQIWDDTSEVNVDDLKRQMKRESSQIICRYWKEYEGQVRQQASDLHERMMMYYGKDLILYPDGLSMAADWQKEFRWHWESKPPHEVKEVIEKHGLKKCRPETTLPKDLLEHKNGIGVFLNPNEGKEIMTNFTSLIAGLERKGETLTDDQQCTIRGLFDADALSPMFVKRMLEEYGDESIKTAFLLKGDLPSYWLDYLLRSHKGHFYRKRYPFLSVI
jgi:hypothetical protein